MSRRSVFRQPVFTVGTLCAAILVLSTACGGDGRELRPPTEPPPAPTEPPAEEPADGADQLPDDAMPADTVEDVGDIDDDSALLPEFDFGLFAAWTDGDPIDARHTCVGDDVSPALTWTGVPDGTVELALTVIDEQAEGFVHWVVTGIDPAAVSTLEDTIPPGASELDNSFGEPGWVGPCPPEGATHTYVFSLHALDQQIEGLDHRSPAEAVALVDGLAFAAVSITGTFGR